MEQHSENIDKIEILAEDYQPAENINHQEDKIEQNIENVKISEWYEQFWKERKESFVLLKLWEENRLLTSQSLAIVVSGMLRVLLQRIDMSSQESDRLLKYFESYINQWNEHIINMEKNTKKNITPIRENHAQQNTKFVQFMTNIENIDLVYTQNQKKFIQKVQQLVNVNLIKPSQQMLNLFTKNFDEYKERDNSYKDNVKITAFLFSLYKMHFENLEDQQSTHYQNLNSEDQHCKNTSIDDSFILEQRYIQNTQILVKDLQDLREMLIRVWQEAIDFEQQRMQGIYTLYEELIKSNQQMFGIDILKEIVLQKDQFQKPIESYQFRGIIREKELQAFASICHQVKLNVDLNNIQLDQVFKVLKSIRLDPAPISKLIQRVGLLQRDPGLFKGWKDSTVVLTRDLFVHIYPWYDHQAHQKLMASIHDGKQISQLQHVYDKKHQQKDALNLIENNLSVSQLIESQNDWSKPFVSINISNLKSLTLKKEFKLEIQQSKPSKSKIFQKKDELLQNSKDEEITKQGLSNLNELIKQAENQKFSEKVTVKGENQNVILEWYELLRSLNPNVKLIDLS